MYKILFYIIQTYLRTKPKINRVKTYQNFTLTSQKQPLHYKLMLSYHGPKYEG